MAILKNGALADYKILHAGAELDRATHNGTVELWVKAIPYTVVLTDYPLSEGESGNYSNKSVTTGDTGYTLKVKKAEGSVGHGYINASVILPTQKCNRVRVKYSTSVYAVGRINDEAVNAGVTDQYMVLNCTGDEFNLSLYLQDETAYYMSELTIKEVSFYYESV